MMESAAFRRRPADGRFVLVPGNTAGGVPASPPRCGWVLDICKPAHPGRGRSWARCVERLRRTNTKFPAVNLNQFIRAHENAFRNGFCPRARRWTVFLVFPLENRGSRSAVGGITRTIFRDESLGRSAGPEFGGADFGGTGPLVVISFGTTAGREPGSRSGPRHDKSELELSADSGRSGMRRSRNSGMPVGAGRAVDMRPGGRGTRLIVVDRISESSAES